MAAPDEETSLLVPPQSPRWRLAAIALGSLAAGLLVLGQPVMPQPWARAALTELSEEEEFSTVYDILVTQDYTSYVICDGETPPVYALCGFSTCSPYDDGSESTGACACKERSDASNFLLSGSNIFLARSATYRTAVLQSYAGTFGDAETTQFCAALGDGTICSESGMGCDRLSFHNQEYRRELAAPELKPDIAGPISTSCMGAPCWYSATDDCEMTCLCTMGSDLDQVTLGGSRRNLGNVTIVQETGHCMTHLDDYTVVTSEGAALGLIEDMVAAGTSARVPQVTGSCAACTVSSSYS